MPDLLTRVDEGERRPTMRQLYEAARHDHISRAHERTFEEWTRKVSDYGLDDAEQAYIAIRDCEHARLKDAVVEAAIARKLLDRTFHNNMDVDEYETAMARYDELEAVYDKAVDALLAFEAEHQLTSTPKGAAP